LDLSLACLYVRTQDARKSLRVARRHLMPTPTMPTGGIRPPEIPTTVAKPVVCSGKIYTGKAATPQALPPMSQPGLP
jgi:2-keto-3-deoxy-6-phosphogluconate aldolase